MYNLEKAQRILEEIKKRVPKGDFPKSVSVDRHDISTVLKPLQLSARFAEITWQVQQAQIIEVKPMVEVIATARDRRRASRSINPGECYYNAVKVCQKLGASYCEGWYVSESTGYLIRHAWNRLNGHFFDVTGEEFDDDFCGRLYVWSFEVGPEEAQELWKCRKDRFFPFPFLAGVHYEKQKMNT